MFVIFPLIEFDVDVYYLFKYLLNMADEMQFRNRLRYLLLNFFLINNCLINY